MVPVYSLAMNIHEMTLSTFFLYHSIIVVSESYLLTSHLKNLKSTCKNNIIFNVSTMIHQEKMIQKLVDNLYLLPCYRVALIPGMTLDSERKLSCVL